MKNKEKMTEERQNFYWFWVIVITGSIFLGLCAPHVIKEKIQKHKIKTEQEAQRLVEEAIPGF